MNKAGFVKQIAAFVETRSTVDVMGDAKDLGWILRRLIIVPPRHSRHRGGGAR